MPMGLHLTGPKVGQLCIQVVLALLMLKEELGFCLAVLHKRL